jgi:hypothetical protein
VLGCAGFPKVTLNVLDTKNNIATPYKITEYDENSCEAVAEKQPKIHILSPVLNGGVCLSVEDYTKVKSYLQTECENKKDRNVQMD